jgi:predicted RNA-binding Zn ribbon-like protein
MTGEKPAIDSPQPGGRAPAPGELALVQAFVNTNDREGGTDSLASPEPAQEWLRERGLLGADDELADSELPWLRAVREALRARALANNGLPADERSIGVLDQAAARTLAVRFGAGGPALEPIGSCTERAVGRLLAIVAEARQDGTWPRVKACRRDVCRWLFYDHSRNRASSWCSMAVCGNRTKTRAYRRRRKARA